MTANNENNRQIIYTLNAKCRDCYKCLKNCPVKAIKMEKGQAYVDQDKCIYCATCLKECPQKAKVYAKDVDCVNKMLDDGAKIAVSLAPSFAAFFEKSEYKRFISALRLAGFFYIAETCNAADSVAAESLKAAMSDKKNFHIASSCPVITNYLEKYQPELINNLLNVPSPMIMHGFHLKQKLGAKIKVVFIGPCIAKKKEAMREEYSGIIDAVLTFEEIAEILENKNIQLINADESDFDETPSQASTLFPLSGGLFKTAGINFDSFDMDYTAVSGINQVKEILNHAKASQKSFFIEPLFCGEGCINGPAGYKKLNLFEKKTNVLNYQLLCKNNTKSDKDFKIIKTNFIKQTPNIIKFPEEKIKEVLAKIGKISEDDYLNCGACGYSSCMEKAEAYLNGFAEIEMCIPYMKRIAEQRTDKIIETSPNGIVIIDKNLNILKMNPSFMKLFNCDEAITGKNISLLMDPYVFDGLLNGHEVNSEFTIEHNDRNMICHEIFYALNEDDQYVGIFIDITKNENDSRKHNEIKKNAIKQAENLLKKHIEMSQKITEFLGETGAISESLVGQLINTFGDNNDKHRQ